MINESEPNKFEPNKPNINLDDLTSLSAAEVAAKLDSLVKSITPKRDSKGLKASGPRRSLSAGSKELRELAKDAAKGTLEPLTPLMLDVLTFIEQHFHQFNGTLPLSSTLEDRFPTLDIDKLMQHGTFRLSLINRGIEPPVGPYKDIGQSSALPKELTNEQLAAAISITNFEDKRSRASKLRELGITTSQWMGWLKQPKFRDYLLNLSGTNLENASYVANENLVKAMDRGDINAIKFYNEITGRWTPQSSGEAKQSQNIRTVLARVVEAIQRHVHDPEILRAIGEDFEAILNGTIEPSRQLAE